MKIINKGKYTKNIYKCKNCECEFEIDYDDISYEQFCLASRIKLYINCPECQEKIIIYDGEYNGND